MSDEQPVVARHLPGSSDPYEDPREPAERIALQLEAINTRLLAYRASVPVLDRAANEAGITEITSLEDVVPLLFPPSVYSSYPEAFVARENWAGMTAWLSTVTTRPIAADVEGVVDIDGWLERLRTDGHHAYVTSAASGKCGVLDHTDADVEYIRESARQMLQWLFPSWSGIPVPAFFLLPGAGSFVFNLTKRLMAEIVGRPGDIHFLSDEPALAVDITRMGALQRAMAQGNATPGEIEASQVEAAARQAQMETAFSSIAEILLARADEPVFIFGPYEQLHRLMGECRAQGGGTPLPSGSLILAGSSRTGSKTLGPGYAAEIATFFLGTSAENMRGYYGTSEMTTLMPECEAQRYHCPATVVPFIVDGTGDRLVSDGQRGDGPVRGRMAFFDLAIEARWGAMVTGDQVVLDGSPCPCGRPGPTVSEVVPLASLPAGEAKLTCAGTMDAYVRGALS